MSDEKTLLPSFSDPFMWIPEPYRSLIRLIKPRDMYVIQETKWGECVGMLHVKADDPAHRLHHAQSSFAVPHFQIRTLSGRAFRSQLIQLARAEGNVIPFLTLDEE